MRGEEATMVYRSIDVPDDPEIALTVTERCRSLTSSLGLDASPDELLLLSGGPISDISRMSLIAGPPRTRVLLRQPDEVESPVQGSALEGSLNLSTPPHLSLTIQKWSNGWQDELHQSVENLAAALDTVARLQPRLPPSGRIEAQQTGGCHLVESIDVRPGAIAGLLGYDLGRWTQPVGLASPPLPGELLGLLYVVEAWVLHDRINRRLCLVSSPDHPWSNLSLDELLSPISSVEEHPRTACAIESQSDEDHANRVKDAIEAIQGGHLYQLNYGRRWSAPLAEDPWRIMRRLSEQNPAPYAGWLHARDLGIAIASSSPESLLAIDGRTMRTRPIKGTRPRGADPASDRLLMREMIASRKEVAEHMMLVDLERNDLGKIASPGSVRWSDWRIEALPQVQHMVSEVVADLHPDLTLSDALQAVFPGGSITGCPKAATMAAISELEAAPRGAWTGSLGIHDPRCGMARWNILIRTLEARQESNQADANAAWFGNVQAGGGIVVESSPAREVEEAHWKAAALLDAAWSGRIAGIESPPLAAASMTAIAPINERTTSLLERLDAEIATAVRLAGAPPIAVGRIDEWSPEADSPEHEGASCLLVDNLDSFTWNIAHAVAELGMDVTIVPGRGPQAPAADHPSVLALIEYLQPSHIILGPGPSTPEASPLTLAIARLALDPPTVEFPSLLGLCLGHQALGMAAGWVLSRAEGGAVHGVPSPIDHDGTGLFGSVEGRATMMRYHSLTIQSPEPNRTTPLVANAWSPAGEVMGIRHPERDIHGVQFHPESCGSPDGLALLQRFLSIAS